MPSLPRPVVRGIARFGIRPLLSLPRGGARRSLEALARVSIVPGGLSVAAGEYGGIKGERVVPEGREGPVRLLYLHGGGYVVGSPRTHRNVVAALAIASDSPVFAADYRLAPEDPAPAALEDALAAYEALAAEAPVAVAGDSAGGGLSVALAVAARDRGLPAPPCLALISPWVDGTGSGSSYVANSRSDALLTPKLVERYAQAYMPVLGREDPRCSPIRADLSGLPPILIHAGSDELFVSEARELAERSKAAGVDTELHVFDGLWHDFHVHAGMLHEADQAAAAMGAWLADHQDT